MAEFDWQDRTDSEYAWEEIPDLSQIELDDSAQRVSHPEKPAAINVTLSKRSKIWLGLITLGIICISLVSWLANQRTTQIQNQLSQEILSSHKLLETAQINNDVELFISLLSGSNQQWAVEQIDLFEQGGHHEALLYGLQPLPLAENSNIRVELSADLTSATLVTTRQYADTRGEIIRLEQTYFYRPGPSRWLLAPPPVEYWGEWQIENSYDENDIFIHHYELDFQFAQLLDQKLGSHFSQLCPTDVQDDFPCDPLYQNPWYSIQLSLDNDLDLLMNPRMPIWPSPTLIGQPLDETSLERLADEYTRTILNDILSQTTGALYTKPERTTMHLFIAQEQLANLGLIDSTLTNITPSIEIEIEIEVIQPLLTAPIDYGISATHDEFLLYYLHQVKQTPLRTISNYLLDDSKSFNDLLVHIGLSQEILRDDLRKIVSDQSIFDLEQNIATICTDPDNPEASIEYQYHSETGSWIAKNKLDQWASLHIMEDDQRQLISLNSNHSVLPQTVLYVPNRTTRYEIFRGDFRAAGLIPAPSYYNREGHFSLVTLAEDDYWQFYEFDESQCTAEACQPAPARVIPLWSETSTHYIDTLNGNIKIVDFPAGDRTALGAVDGPAAWLDETRFIYPQNDADQLNYYMGTIGNDERKLIFSWADMMTQLDADNFPWPDKIELTNALFLPNQSEILLLQYQVTDDPNLTKIHQSGFIFIDWQQAEVVRFIEDLGPASGTIRFSPDGRWLLWETRGYPYNHLIELHRFYSLTQTFSASHDEPFASTHYNLFDWSADSHWLLMFNHGYLQLIAPQPGETHTIPYPAGVTTCHGGGFTDLAP